MQENAGLRKILMSAGLFECFQRLIGSHYANKWVADRFWKLQDHQKMIDIGCGTGTVMRHVLANVQFVGLDVDENYIRRAQERYGQRGVFVTGTTEDYFDDPRFANADLVTVNSTLHHLDDHEVLNVLQFARKNLKNAGRLVCSEPCFLAHHGKFSQWIMNKDRGRNIRNENEWKTIIGKIFPSFTTTITTNLWRLPYTYIIIEAQKSDRPFSDNNNK